MSHRENKSIYLMIQCLVAVTCVCPGGQARAEDSSSSLMSESATVLPSDRRAYRLTGYLETVGTTLTLIPRQGDAIAYAPNTRPYEGVAFKFGAYDFSFAAPYGEADTAKGKAASEQFVVGGSKEWQNSRIEANYASFGGLYSDWVYATSGNAYGRPDLTYKQLDVAYTHSFKASEGFDFRRADNYHSDSRYLQYAGTFGLHYSHASLQASSAIFPERKSIARPTSMTGADTDTFMPSIGFVMFKAKKNFQFTLEQTGFGGLQLQKVRTLDSASLMLQPTAGVRLLADANFKIFSELIVGARADMQLSVVSIDDSQFNLYTAKLWFYLQRWF